MADRKSVQAAASFPSDGGRAPTADLPKETLLLSIPPPRPVDLHVQSLDIGLPSSAPSMGARLSKAFGRAPKETGEGKEDKNWIVRDVDVDCKSGEVLALIGGSGSGTSPDYSLRRSAHGLKALGRFL